MQYIVLILLFVISPLLYGTAATTYVAAIEAVLLLLLSLNKFRVLKNYNLSSVSVVFFLYFIWLLIILVINPIEVNSVLRIIQIIGCFSAFIVASTTKWKSKTINFVVSIVSIVVVIMFIFWIALSGLNMTDFSFIYENPDTYGSLLFVLFTFLFFSRKPILLSIILCFLLVYFTGSRATMISCIIFAIMYFLFKKDFISKKSNVWLIIEAAIIVTFIIIYPMLMTFDIGSELDDLSHQYFNKNLFSGRHVLWVELLEKISQSPIVGHGLSADPQLIGFTKSSHNLYLQTALQSGIIGLLLLVAFVSSIYMKLGNLRIKTYSNLSMCFILGLLIHECFEICLTQNAIVIGYMMWFIMGLGCNRFLERCPISNEK